MARPDDVRNALVTVASTATALNGPSVGGQVVEVHNSDGVVSMFWGGSTVTATTGLPILAGATKTFTLAPDEVLYAAVAAATAVARVGRVGAV